MFSSANDGLVIVWSSGSIKHDVISIRSPVYSMTINPRRQQLVCGMSGRICAYDLDPDRESGHLINPLRPAHIAKEHNDIVKVVLCYESRIYSAGYDKKLIIYDSSYNGEKSMTPVHIHRNAHEAGICTLVISKDWDSTWIITGSFDKTVKIWSVDGKLIHRLEGFLSTVTGVCYVPRNKTVWIASGSSNAQLYDPKSGDNISDYIGTFQSTEDEYKYSLIHLKWQPEMNQVIGTTSRRQIIVWKYNPSGCITALRNKQPIESISYTHKRPILIFTGDHDGSIVKWEQMQSNNFMYSNEAFHVTELMLKKMTKMRRLSDKEKMDLKNTLNRMRDKDRREQKALKDSQKLREGKRLSKSSHDDDSKFIHPNKSILSTLFVEDLDIILAASEDGNIYVWGFDDSAVAVLQDMKRSSEKGDNSQDMSGMEKYAILLKDTPSASQLSHSHMDENQLAAYKRMKEEESVSNRVAGFICKYILTEHRSCVTSMCVVHKSYSYESTYLVSGGWDHRLCIWNLESGSLHSTFKDRSHTGDIKVDEDIKNSEWASDGVITCLQYNPDQNEIAYGSSDHLVYIRKFSPEGSQMPLLNTLQHDGEVTALKWNSINKQWVSGSEDGTIKIWAADGMNDLIQTLSEKVAITCLCIDSVNGAIVAGLQSTIKVYDGERFRLMQTNVGHTDSVRDIIHIPERSQYVSCSWDKTIRVWNEWKQVKKRNASDKDKNDIMEVNVPQKLAHTYQDDLEELGED
ncbi:hypothetical protein EB796_010866 [Bugula neritina]|uniref:WD40 repeat-like protein n=1 Tax=Bugula neritina TaxID=10212 RepID=A0A7J7JWR2_BUGNE|nr:hypothetical protein EB796_010866 [Bugula neritina]